MSVKTLVERLLSPLAVVPQFKKHLNPSPLKRRCSSCTRWLAPDELVMDTCPYCLEEKAHNAIYNFRPFDVSKQEFPQCYQCHQPIVLVGLRTWDTLARSFALLCTACGEKQIEKDNQYRDSPWGYQQKLK